MSGATVSNADLMAAVYGPLPEGVTGWITSIAGDPRVASGDAWAGATATPWTIPESPEHGNYFTLATFKGRRSLGAFHALHGVLLDDVGTKAPRDLPLPPSVLIETSAGNFQALYLLAEPLTDLDLIARLHRALVAQGLTDAGAGGLATRYGRLPFGANLKGGGHFQCSLPVCEPSRRYTLDGFLQGLGLVLDPPAVARTSPDWDALPEAECDQIKADLRSALEWLDPDKYGPWISVGIALSAMGDEGEPIWIDWSRRSPKFDEGQAEAKWAGFSADQTGYAAIFTRAQAAGWTNPRVRQPVDPVALFGIGPVTLPSGALPAPALAPLPPIHVPPFKPVSLADLWTRPAVPQRWVWHHLIPCGHVALLAGHGGSRKSSLALRLAACVAVGQPFLGVPTAPGRVCFFSAEDPGELVRLRLGHICRDLGTDPATLAQSLDVLDATEGQPALFAEVRAPGVRMATTTAAYETLRQHVEATRPALLIVDNASDTYAADEIDRASVRGFVRALALLVREWDGAVLLLAHVDKATSRTPKGMGSNTESYSGSTAWHNSVRSRMFLAETSPGVFELAHQKSNLGPKREPIAVIWPADGPPHVLEAAQCSGEDGSLRALVALVAEFAGRGEYVSTSSTSPANAVKLFGAEPSYPRGMKVAEALAILRDGERRNLLAREQYRTPDRKSRERFAITDLGRQFLAGAPTAPTVRQVEVGAVSAPGGGAPAPTTGGVGELAHLAHPTVQTLPDPSNTPDVCAQLAQKRAA